MSHTESHYASIANHLQYMVEKKEWEHKGLQRYHHDAGTVVAVVGERHISG